MLENLSPIHIVVFLSLSGIVLRSSLSIVGQNWVKTYHFLGTFVLLPNIAYIITTVIAGDIALSLGMIGALSIVRFRHPVKSALELVIYFALITIGIATSVRTKWAIQLIICTILIILIVKGIQILSKKIGKSFYNVSFNEGNVSNTLEVISKKRVEAIEKSDNLVNYISDINSQQYIYRLNFTNRKSLEDFRDGLAKEKNIYKVNVVLN